MRLVISSADPVLSRTLYLEAKRLLLPEACPDTTLFLVDLDHPDPAVTPDTGSVSIGFSSDPKGLPTTAREGICALLSLPFSVRELSHALSLLLPRVPTALVIGDKGRLLLGGKAITLSRTESALFSLLYENRHRTVSEAEMAAVIGPSATESNAVSVYLYRLRRKLSPDGRTRITTLRGKGARWTGEEALSL